MHDRKIDKFDLSSDFGLTAEIRLTKYIFDYATHVAKKNNMTLKAFANLIDVNYRYFLRTYYVSKSSIDKRMYKQKHFNFNYSIKVLSKMGFEIELKITHPKTTSSNVNVESTDLKNLE